MQICHCSVILSLSCTLLACLLVAYWLPHLSVCLLPVPPKFWELNPETRPQLGPHMLSSKREKEVFVWVGWLAHVRHLNSIRNNWAPGFCHQLPCFNSFHVWLSLGKINCRKETCFEVILVKIPYSIYKYWLVIVLRISVLFLWWCMIELWVFVSKYQILMRSTWIQLCNFPCLGWNNDIRLYYTTSLGNKQATDKNLLPYM